MLDPDAPGPAVATRDAARVTLHGLLVQLKGYVQAARRASYEWEYSTDGGKTWVAAPPSLQSKTTVTGLLSATMTQFRSAP